MKFGKWLFIALLPLWMLSCSDDDESQSLSESADVTDDLQGSEIHDETAILDEQSAQEGADLDSEVLLTSAELVQAMTVVSADANMPESWSKSTSLEACDVVQGKTIGACPSYQVQCEQNKPYAITATWGNADCGPCRKAGIPISGQATFALESGGFTIAFDNFEYGHLSINGSVQVQSSRSNTLWELSITTPDQPLEVTRTTQEGSKTYEITLNPLSIANQTQEEDRWVIRLDAQVHEQEQGLDFVVQTKDASKNDDPLIFPGVFSQCLGPIRGSLKAGIQIQNVSFFAIATFGSPAGMQEICSKPDASFSTEPPNLSPSDVLEQSKVALKAKLEAFLGNVDIQDLLGSQAIEKIMGPTWLRAIQFLTRVLDKGDLQKALNEGWMSLVCDASNPLPCEEGSGTSTISCSNLTPNRIDLDFNQCVIQGVTYEGKLSFEREVQNTHPSGLLTFEGWSADQTHYQGSVHLEQLSQNPLEVQATAEDQGLHIWVDGQEACAYDLTFYTWRMAFDTDATEVEFWGERQTSQGVYGLKTLPNNGRHPWWSKPISCLCPDPGSKVQVLLPSVLGLPDNLPAEQVVLEITYGPGNGQHCATAELNYVDWPYRDPTGSLKTLAEESMKPIVESMCQPLP